MRACGAELLGRTFRNMSMHDIKSYNTQHITSKKITLEVRRSKWGNVAAFGSEAYGSSAGQLSHGFEGFGELEGLGGLISVLLLASVVGSFSAFVAASAIFVVVAVVLIFSCSNEKQNFTAGTPGHGTTL